MAEPDGPTTCSTCGADNGDASTFCRSCGARLPTPATNPWLAPPAGEEAPAEGVPAAGDPLAPEAPGGADDRPGEGEARGPGAARSPAEGVEPGRARQSERVPDGDPVRRAVGTSPTSFTPTPAPSVPPPVLRPDPGEPGPTGAEPHASPGWVPTQPVQEGQQGQQGQERLSREVPTAESAPVTAESAQVTVVAGGAGPASQLQGPQDPHGLAPAVARMSPQAAQLGYTATAVAAALLESGESVSVLVQGLVDDSYGVVVLSDRRVLLVAPRPWVPGLVSLRLAPPLTVEGWAEGGAASLTFTGPEGVHRVSHILDTELAVELAHRLRAAVAAPR